MVDCWLNPYALRNWRPTYHVYILQRDKKAALPRQITQEFKSYYKSLFNLNTTHPPPERLSEYVATSLMPTLSTEMRDLLEDPFILPELQLAIGSTKPGKAPGPDSLTISYYKALLPSLGKHLVTLFNDLSKGGTLHGTTLQAQI